MCMYVYMYMYCDGEVPKRDIYQNNLPWFCNVCVQYNNNLIACDMYIYIYVYIKKNNGEVQKRDIAP